MEVHTQQMGEDWVPFVLVAQQQELLTERFCTMQSSQSLCVFHGHILDLTVPAP